MTSTPESWDDVGCLRLQVDCISKQVGGLNVLEFQKLRDDVALIHAQEQERKKERCQIKVCIIITALLLGCVLTLLIFIVYTGSASRLTQKLPDQHWEAHLDDFKPPEATFLVPAIQDDESLEVESVLHPQSSAGTDRRTQRVAKILDEGPEDAKDSDSSEGGEHDNGEQPREQSEDPEVSPPIDRGDFMPEDSAEEEKREAMMATPDDPSSLVLPPLSFQMMNREVLKRSNQGVLWVCFPPSSLDQSVEKFAEVFNEVARQTWPMYQYPFCYLNTRRIKGYHDHFCDDIEKITFVLEKSNDNQHASSRPAPKGFSSDPVESPSFFRRVFRPDQDIHVSLVQEFLNDVHSGKLQEVIPPKGDL